MSVDYLIPDGRTVSDALIAADAHRNHPDQLVAALVIHIDRLVAEVRDKAQAHAESLEAYGALRRRVRDAVAADDYS
jgi:hypothetical protein